MNKYFLLICFYYGVLVSCSVTNYQIISNTNTGLNFKEGKWLMNYIDTTFENEIEFNNWISNDFNNLLGNRLFYIQKLKDNQLLKKISIEPDKSTLEYLKNNSNSFDFFINIQAKKSISYENASAYQNSLYKTSNKKFYNIGVTIEIYDIKNSVILYSKTVKAQNTYYSNKYSAHLNSTDEGLLKSCYTKIINSIKTNSIY